MKCFTRLPAADQRWHESSLLLEFENKVTEPALHAHGFHHQCAIRLNIRTYSHATTIDCS